MPNGPNGKEGSQGAERGSYLGFVAHEVRNPLSTALWSAELLARMAAEDRAGARGEKLTAMCLRSLGRVRQLIEDHFLSERLDAGGIPVRAERHAMGEVLAGVLERRGPDAGPMTVAGDEDVAIATDRALLDRALDAVVAAAGRDGSPVYVEVGAADGRASIRVAGAPPLPEALADPRKGSASDPRGRALALPLARRIASALGGRLELTGDGYGLSLPAAGESTAGIVPDPGPHP